MLIVLGSKFSFLMGVLRIILYGNGVFLVLVDNLCVDLVGLVLTEGQVLDKFTEPNVYELMKVFLLGY